MDTDDKLGIKLDIAGHQVSITIPRNMEEYYRRAGKHINQRINIYADMYPERDKEQILYMALVDIALSYELSEERNDVEPYCNLLNKLTSEIEETLGEK